MRALRFNADFEERLSGKPPRPQLNATLEFFAFWLTNRPVLVHREYPSKYLDHIHSQTGSRPVVVTSGDAEDWWGQSKPEDLMRSLNSKTEFLRWCQEHWPMQARVCENLEAIRACVLEGTYLIKASDGMSGRGHQRVTPAELPQLIFRWKDPVVVEPLFRRTRDVSALWIAEENRFIYYANEIDQRFQWRGSLLHRPTVADPPSGTGDWSLRLEELQRSVAARGYTGPFSVDAFFYGEEGNEHFHPGSEMNPRKTMGWLAYQFAKEASAQWVKLAMRPVVLSEETWANTVRNPSAQLLSPPLNPFVWYIVRAESAREVLAREAEFLKALPGAQARGKA